MSTDYNTVFVPKGLVTRMYDRQSVEMYPTIEMNWPKPEKNYAYMTNLAALDAQTFSFSLKIQAMASSTGTEPLVGIMRAKFRSVANAQIFEAGNFEVVSYHSSNGMSIMNAKLANGNLKPCNGPDGIANNDRRPSDIMYAKLICNLKFTDADPTNRRIVPFTYFVTLPMENITVQNTIGNDLQLNTFHGPDDWASSNDQNIVDAVLRSPSSFGEPFKLEPPAIDNRNPAVVVSTKDKLHSAAMEVAYASILPRIFEQICPGADNDPIKIITALRQSSIDDKGEKVILSIKQFHSNLLNVTNFLSSSADAIWPVDITQHFVTHLLNDITEQMHANSFAHNAQHARKDPFSQIMSLSAAFTAATVAESQLARVRKITTDQIRSSMTLHSQAHQARTLASTAESTIQEYSSRPSGQRFERACWGCGSKDHAYAKGKEIICPNKDKPGVAEAAAKNFQGYRDRRAVDTKMRKALKAKKSGGTKSFLAGLSYDQVKSLSADQLSVLMGNSGGDPAKNNKAAKKTHTFVVVFEAGASTLPRLPIIVASDLPHIAIPIGHASSGESQFSLNVAYDTCAGCNVGFIGHHLPIAEKFPHLVKSITTTAKKFTPITLSGIVASDETTKENIQSVKTHLTVIIEYHLPFLTKEGHEVSLKIALGEDVSVNTIIGIPMIRPAKMSFDATDNVVMNGILDTEPFPVTYRPTSKTSPDFSGVESGEPKLLSCTAEHITSDDVKAIRSSIDEASADAATIEEGSITPKESIRTIQVPKTKWRPKASSLWTEEENNQNPHHDFNFQFQQKSNHVLRKYNEASLPPPNPKFHRVYDNSIDSKELEANLRLDSSTPIDIQKRIRKFVIEFWDVFSEAGVCIPIRGYEMIINTGNHAPVACRQPRYGMHETPIMQKTIDKLIKLGFIIRDSTSPWASRITLASKPHQESVTEIEKYEWRFCINYIRLNMVTRPAEYPIPRCDDAVMYGFGTAQYFILLDAYSGYHQVRLTPESMAKTAFHAPNGRKYCWTVMPFGLKNCPPVYISMMHDLKDLWTEMATAEGLDMSRNNGSTLIVDDTFIFAVGIEHIFLLVRCICLISRKYHLTWKLKKAQWLPSKVEFVGVDLHRDGGNTPAESKDIILENWKIPSTPREAMGFIGFAIFYLRWCPWFEQTISPIREAMSDFTLDHTFSAEQFPPPAIAAFHKVRRHILSKPILQRANIEKRFYLKTDFSALGLGFALCQPDDSDESIAAMQREISGGPCEFDFAVSKLRLLLVALGSRRTKGSEIHFHSHPGEALAACWSIIKNRHFLWGREFSLLTDCRALMWLMDYKGHNHAVHRLQLELLGYSFSIVNRPGKMLEDANYFSRLGANIHIDPLLKDYLSIARQSLINNPTSSDELNDQNMPGRRAKRAKMATPSQDSSVNFARAEILEEPIDLTPSTFDTDRHFANIPINIVETGIVQSQSNKHFAYATEAAVHLNCSTWCLSQTGHGHFIQASREAAIKFEAIIICDTDPNCRNTMQSEYGVPFILDSPSALADHCDQENLPIINGYFAQLDTTNDIQHAFRALKIHERIITQLRSKSNLELFIIQFPLSANSQAYLRFKARLNSHGWMIQEQNIQSSVHFSDRIAIDFDIIVGINNQFHHEANPLHHLSPTPVTPNTISPNILVEFNQPKYSVPYIGELFTVEETAYTPSREPTVQYIVRQSSPTVEANLDVGYQVYNKDSPAPIPSQTNIGLFGSLFGISFANPSYSASNNQSKELIRSISIAEYTSLFGYDNNYSSYLNRQTDVSNILRRTLPSNTAHRIIETADHILQASSLMRRSTASEASGFDLSIPALFNGVIANELPDASAWAIAYRQDKLCSSIIRMILNPHTITTKNINEIHPIYRAPLRQSKIKWEDERLILEEPVAQSTKIVRLIIVPSDLRHHMFASFHSNPLGGHLSVYYTLHRIRIRYHWPNMYKYIRENIESCAACILRNSTSRASSELLYTFPLSAPFMAVHADAWVPGKTVSHGGAIGLMIVVCHMTGFTAIEPLRAMNSTSFAKTVYSIMLRYGLSQCVITDPDSKFKAVFKDAMALLKVDHHMSAKGNHNAILVERFNKFLNAGLRVFNNDRETNKVFLEGAETLTYAWNSCPVLGTDLSRSLLTVGREFQFPIDFEASKKITFGSSAEENKTFADGLSDLLTKSREIYAILISEHRAAHRELRNSQINNPREFKVGDIVFTNVQVQSKKLTGTVAKLSYIKRGPYKIIKDYRGGSYELQPLKNRSRVTIKKHGSDLYLCPKSLIPHAPIQSSDQNFGNLSKKSVSQPYKLIGIEGYLPATPWAAPAALSIAQLAIVENMPAFPTLQELDNEFDCWPESGNPFINETTVQSHVPPEVINNQVVTLSSSIRTKPSIIADLVRSQDKLFFIAYAQQRQQTRKEWKLVRVNFEQSLKQHPHCLQDGRFLVEFFIQNYRDDHITASNRRYWLEYHKSNSHKTLSTNYHIIQPSPYSDAASHRLNLTPFREWVQIDDTSVTIHGPFDFATLNNRKTRDRIADKDWQALQHQHELYHNPVPKIAPRTIHVNMTQPIYEIVDGNSEVQTRCQNFMFNLEFNDMTLADFGTHPS